MPEQTNIEIAHQLAEPFVERRPGLSSSGEFLEIAEAVMLALVAVATAWSGYLSAQWDGRQSLLYATSARLRGESAAAADTGRQILLYDALTLNAWIDAKEKNDAKAIAMYERRFTPEFRQAVDAWLKTDPLNKPRAPGGPFTLATYRNASLEQADRLNKEATDAFTEGTQARANSEKYVRITVVLAMVLFLIAIAQRFKLRKVRVGLFLVAALLMVYALATVAMYPRL